MELARLAQVSRELAASRSRLRKEELLAALLEETPPRLARPVVFFLCGQLPQGKIGVGPASLREATRAASPAAVSTLTVEQVVAAVDAIAGVAGAGSVGRRLQLLVELLERATEPEWDFLLKLFFGELRQGALEGVMAAAVARAAGVPAAAVRRAIMVTGQLPQVAAAALEGGEAALEAFQPRLFRPLMPMLASPAADLEEARERLPSPWLEYKLDGARIQVHRQGQVVRVYSRGLNDVTAAVPEVVEAVRCMPMEEGILDGEVLALNPSGRPLPFQDTMKRFGRKTDIEAMRHKLPLTPFFFDCLLRDGELLLDEPQQTRFKALSRLTAALVPHTLDEDPGTFLERAVQSGHEGIMAKDPRSAYEAGSRGFSWLKVKPSHTLDLVVLAAEWGSGRRRGWLSNLHLGARDGADFAMLGKTFKGLTDEMLEWQTRRLLELELGRDGHAVHVRPELVVEIAFNEVQESPHYPSGMALRFARVKSYRFDKPAAEADTLETVRGIFRAARGS